jgi:hypothetical protein
MSSSHLNKPFFLRALIALMVFQISTAGLAIGANCIAIESNGKGSAIIVAQGNYCLLKDIHVAGKFNFFNWEGRSYSSDDDRALVIASNDVNLDLSGHLISSDALDVIGGVISGLVNTGEKGLVKDHYRIASWSASFKNIRVHDGTILLKRGQIGMAFPGSADGWAYNSPRSGVSIDVGFTQRLFEGVPFRTLPPSSVDYPTRSIVIERMKVRSPGYGVVVQGGGTVIRNSVIETDSRVGIWVFGPNALIEGNTIIVHDSGKYTKAEDAPIRLHQADGAIIRNNRIIFEGNGPNEFAISSMNTANFTFQNNEIYGLKEGADWVKAFGTATQVQESETVLKPSLLASVFPWVSTSAGISPTADKKNTSPLVTRTLVPIPMEPKK